MDGKIHTTKPDASVREAKEMAVYELLEKLDIPYERLDHEAAATIADCQDIDKKLGIELCKNLFLCNEKKTKFYLLSMPGNKRFQTKELSRQINSGRLSFAKADAMEKYLGITPGAVSVMGLMNDRENKVEVLVDEDIYNDEYIGCHPCVNTTSLKLRTEDVLTKFLKHTGHNYLVVTL